jgi:hypothetical protein
LPRALCQLPDGPNYRRSAFVEGLQCAGFDVVADLARPGPEDLVVLWNRSGWRNDEARRFEAAGARVLVAENGYLGKTWRGGKWFSLALDHHAGAGRWPDGGPGRWDSWNVELAPWRAGGAETLILAQRGIGEPGIASPLGWAEGVQALIGGRIRQHPGKDAPTVPLEQDLARAASVVTWHSAAALQALLLGVPAWYAFPRWIGAGAARPLAEFGKLPRCDDAARLAMFRRLAWAVWNVDEVNSGQAFQALLAK